MLYRRFGRTEIPMPVFSCGGMRFQYKWQDHPMEEIPAESQRNVEAIVQRALDAGINHFETARGYGSSERQLGQILPKLPRDQIIVQTKIAPESDPQKFRANFLDSLDRLGLDHVDLLGLHGINNEETLNWAIGGCLEVAHEFRREGRTRHVGFSTHASLDVIFKAIETDGFDYVNLHWFYILQRNWPAILEARRRDMGVFIISPSDKGGRLYDPPQKLVALTRPLHPLVFNDLFCLLHPEVHTLSIGAAQATDFDRHLETLEWMDKAAEVIPPIVERLERAMTDAVGEDYSRHYLQGIPRWEDVPGEVNIQTILWLDNLARAYDLVEYGKFRYNLLGNGGHWFPGNNMVKAVSDGVDLNSALRQSPHADQIKQRLLAAHEQLWTEPVKRLSESED